MPLSRMGVEESMRKLTRAYVFGAISILAVAIVGWLLVSLIASKIEQRTAFVDEKINELMISAPYCEGSFQERKELAFQMLLQLKQDGYIFHLTYDELNTLFSFQYADMSLGGIQIKNFNHRPDNLPMN